MAAKYKLTRPELKRFRDRLARYSRYLPMLKLKQQQLQMSQREISRKRREAREQVQQATAAFTAYEGVLVETAGVAVRTLADPKEVRTGVENIAGVNIPVFEDVVFPEASYSLFGTPAWVDQALGDLRDLNQKRAVLDVFEQQYARIAHELTRIIQRVNLFEKVKIPEAREAIRVIRIKLGDEMTDAVGRAKIAKNKLSSVVERDTDVYFDDRNTEVENEDPGPDDGQGSGASPEVDRP